MDVSWYKKRYNSFKGRTIHFGESCLLVCLAHKNKQGMLITSKWQVRYCKYTQVVISICNQNEENEGNTEGSSSSSSIPVFNIIDKSIKQFTLLYDTGTGITENYKYSHLMQINFSHKYSVIQGIYIQTSEDSDWPKLLATTAYIYICINCLLHRAFNCSQKFNSISSQWKISLFLPILWTYVHGTSPDFPRSLPWNQFSSTEGKKVFSNDMFDWFYFRATSRIHNHKWSRLHAYKSVYHKPNFW